MNTFKSEIQKRMIELGIGGQVELAKIAGISQSLVSAALNGKSNSKEAIIKIQKAIDMISWIREHSDHVSVINGIITVGGSLYLSGLTSIPDGFNPTVGGDLELSGLTANVKRLRDGDYVPGEYLYADGILAHIKRAKNLSNGITWYVGKIPSMQVVSDGKNYAHGRTLRQALSDLMFKTSSDRGAEQYRGYKIDHKFSLEDATVMYRIITGACSGGVEQFIKDQKEIKECYTPEEIITLTTGSFGGDTFRKFWEG